MSGPSSHPGAMTRGANALAPQIDEAVTQAHVFRIIGLGHTQHHEVHEGREKSVEAAETGGWLGAHVNVNGTILRHLCRRCTNCETRRLVATTD
jgi:hypothetical protein